MAALSGAPFPTTQLPPLVRPAAGQPERAGASGEAVLVDFGLSRHDHLPDLLDHALS